MTKRGNLYSIESLQRYYYTKAETVKAIRDIDLEISKDEFITILGPSGSGKTTLLNLLSGLDHPTSGKIMFEESRDLTQLSDAELCEYRNYEIGIVFQFYNMHPALTAQENIEYPLLIANVPQNKRETRALELLKQFKLEDKRLSFPNELSGGEKQRVGIARALANKPKVLIADEPTGDLDSEAAAEVINYLAEVNKAGTAIIMVTHDEELLQEQMRCLSIIDGTLKEE
jgi:putative ABC transport system ATP-binding protein